MNEISEQITRAGGRTICLGRAIAEYVADEPSESVDDVESWTVFPGGSAANVAFGLRALNCPATFMGCIGNDANGKLLLSRLSEAGVDVSGVRTIFDCETGWLWTVRKPNGDRVFYPPIASFELLADTRVTPLDLDPGVFSRSKIFIPQSAHLGPTRSREALEHGLSLAKKNGVFTFFDVNFRDFAWNDEKVAKEVSLQFAKQCEFLKASVEEARWLCQAPTIKEFGKLFPNARGIFLTKGSAGCDFFLDGTSGSVPGFHVETVDSTGAGDAFVAGLVSRFAKQDLSKVIDKALAKEMITFANATGAICVSKMGAVNNPATEEQVTQFIQGSQQSNPT